MGKQMERKTWSRKLYRTEYAWQLTTFRIEIRRIRNKFKIHPPSNILGRITVIVNGKGKSKHKLVEGIR